MKRFLSIFCLVFPNVVTVVSSYIAYKSIKTAIIYTMPTIIITLGITIIILLLDIKQIKQEKDDIQKKLDEETSKNEAIAHQYNLKRKQNEMTETYWRTLNVVFLNAIQGTAKDRFKEAYNLYLNFTQFIENSKEE